jgi:hypothetical protein
MWQSQLEEILRKEIRKPPKKKKRQSRFKSKALILVFSVIFLVIGWVTIAHGMSLPMMFRAFNQMFSGGPTQDITVTANPHAGVLPPIDLTVTYVSDTDLLVEWINDTLAAGTAIVVNYTHYPATRTDGYVLYDDLGTSVHDISVNLDEYWGSYYVSAWSRDGAGVWTTGYTSTKYEVDMTALVGELQQWLLFAMLIVLIALSRWLRSPILKIVSGLASLGYGAYFISTNTESYVIIMIGVAFLILGLFQILTSYQGQKA